MTRDVEFRLHCLFISHKERSHPTSLERRRAQVSPPAADRRLPESRLVVLCCAAAVYAVARNHQPGLQLVASFELHLCPCSQSLKNPCSGRLCTDVLSDGCAQHTNSHKLCAQLLVTSLFLAACTLPLCVLGMFLLLIWRQKHAEQTASLHCIVIAQIWLQNASGSI